MVMGTEIAISITSIGVEMEIAKRQFYWFCAV